MKHLRHWAGWARNISALPGMGTKYKSLLGKRPSSVEDLIGSDCYRLLHEDYCADIQRLESLPGSHIKDMYLRKVAHDIGYWEFICVTLFLGFGSNVFKLSPSLLRLFLETEITFPFKDLRFPYPGFFIELPADSGIIFTSTMQPLQGFYVANMSYTKETAERDTGKSASVMGTQVDKNLYKKVLEENGLNFGQVTGLLKNKGLYKEMEALDKPGTTFVLLGVSRDGKQDTFSDFTMSHFSMNVSVDDADSVEKKVCEIDPVYQKSYPMHKALNPFAQSEQDMVVLDQQMGRLAFNLALYLSQEGSPEALDLRKETEPRLKEYREAKTRFQPGQLGGLWNKVVNEGPVTVTRVGFKFEEKLRGVLESSAGHLVSPHWRRAHWHNYWVGAHGTPGRRLVPKWILHIPVLGGEASKIREYTLA